MEMESSPDDSDVHRAKEDLEASRLEGNYSEPSLNQPKEKDRDIVDWDGSNDQENPHNWPKWKKALCTLSIGSLNFCVTFSSSIMTAAVKPLAELYEVSDTVATLATSLFVLVSSAYPCLSLAALPLTNWHEGFCYRAHNMGTAF